MNSDQDPRLFVFGGMCGIVGTVCYVIASTVPLGQTGTYILAMAWPMLSIVFVFSLYRYVGLEKQSAANQLAFVFACLAFVLVAAMMSTQLAVKAGMQEYIDSSAANEQEALRIIRRSVRLVDMGLDVAWDLFIGTALVFLSIALKGHLRFGLGWALPAVLLGGGLLVLNVVTFPWPPGTRGLFDIGPVVGLFIICLSIRLALLGNRMRRAHPGPAHEK